MRAASVGSTPGRPNLAKDEAMAEADKQIIPRRYYDEEACAALKQHLEQVFARQGAECKINWDELWDELEITARTYTWSVRSLIEEPSYSLGDVLVWHDQTCKLIDDLIKRLNTAPDWRFISAPSISAPSGRLSIRYESPRTEELITLRNKFAADADDLRKLFADQRVHAYDERDSLAELKVTMIKIGQDLIGSEEIGYDEGPLLTFVHLALLPVLGAGTPDNGALRKFANRHFRKPRPLS